MSSRFPPRNANTAGDFVNAFVPRRHASSRPSFSTQDSSRAAQLPHIPTNSSGTAKLTSWTKLTQTLEELTRSIDRLAVLNCSLLDGANIPNKLHKVWAQMNFIAAEVVAFPKSDNVLEELEEILLLIHVAEAVVAEFLMDVDTVKVLKRKNQYMEMEDTIQDAESSLKRAKAAMKEAVANVKAVGKVMKGRF